MSGIKELDPRHRVLAIEAHYEDDNYPYPVNGELILSKVGLHFYGHLYDPKTKAFNDIAPQHFPLVEATSVKGFDLILRANIYTTLGYQSRGYQLGYSREVERVSKRTSTVKEREEFLISVEQIKRQVPALTIPAKHNPHLVLMRYFVELSALSPALSWANSALRFSKLQPIISKGPSLSESAILKQEGYHPHRPQLYPLSKAELTDVKRQRAWLLIEAQAYQQFLAESYGQIDSSAEEKLAYGVAASLLGRGNSHSYFEQAKKLEPDNPRIIAGMAWSMATQQKKAEAEIHNLQNRAEKDQYALLLLGCAWEELGDNTTALDQYIASASLAHGYIEGAIASKQALALARRINIQTEIAIAQRLTQAQPDQLLAWKGLVAAAKRAENHELASQAQEHVTMMEESPI